MKSLKIILKIVLCTFIILSFLPFHTQPVSAQPLTTFYLYDDLAANWTGSGLSGTFRELQTDTWKFTQRAATSGITDNLFKLNTQADNTDNDFNLPAGSKVWSGNLTINGTTPQTIAMYTDGNASAGSFPVEEGSYYTLIFNDVVSTTNTNTEGFVFKTAADPVRINSVSQTTLIDEVSDNDPITFTLRLNKAKGADEKIYLRYTMDSWLTSYAVEVTNFGTGTTGTIAIGPFPATTSVQYYALTTVIDQAYWGDYIELMSINFLYLQQYQFTVKWGTTTNGNWNLASTWKSGVVPNSLSKEVLIAHNVILDMDPSVKRITIRSGGTFTASDSTPRKLTIADSALGFTNFKNNGTFNHGGGTIVFQGAGAIVGTAVFNNVELSPTPVDRGVDFGYNSTVEGTLWIRNYRFVKNNGPSYGASSLLKYDTGVLYGLKPEWQTGVSGRGVPSNVEIVSGTTLSMTYATADRLARGNLTINGRLYAPQSFDLAIQGNWINNGSFTPFTGTVVLNGSTVQSIGGSSTSKFSNLMVNNPAGVSLATAGTVTTTLTISNGMFSNSAAALTIGSGTTIYRMAGSLSNVPTFAGTANLVYTGTIGVDTGPELPVSNSALINMTLGNSGGVTLTHDETVNGMFNLITGTLAIQTHSLTLNSTVNYSGGNLTSEPGGIVTYNQGTDGQYIVPGNYGYLNFSNFNKTLSPTGVIGIASDFNPGTASGHTIISSTVEYNGAASQSLPSGFTTYHNLTLNNPAGVTGISGLTVNGLLHVQQGTFTSSSTFHDVKIESSATLAATPASTMNVTGSWSNDGIFSAGTGTVIFNGTVAQTIEGLAQTTFNNLTINNVSGATGFSGLVVQGLLRLENGVFTTGGDFNNVQIDSLASLVADANIMVSGNWTRNGGFTHGSQTVTFDGAGLQVISGATTFYNLTIANTSPSPSDTNDVDPDSTLIVENDLAISDGQFQPMAGSTFKNINIGPNGILKPDLTAGMTFSGNFLNDGAFTANNSVITLNGAGLQNLTANVPTEFFSLTVSSGITLVETVEANNISISTGGGLKNNGVIRKSINVSGVGSLTFGLTGVGINVTTRGGLNAVQVDRIDSNHPNATIGIQTGKYWKIKETATTNDWMVNINLPQNNLDEPKVCKYPGGLGGEGWDCDRTGYDNFNVWRDGIQSFSDWAVGKRVGPTVVTLRQFEGRGGVEKPIILVVVGASAILLFSAILFWNKRRASH